MLPGLVDRQVRDLKPGDFLPASNRTVVSVSEPKGGYCTVTLDAHKGRRGRHTATWRASTRVTISVEGE